MGRIEFSAGIKITERWRLSSLFAWLLQEPLSQRLCYALTKKSLHASQFWRTEAPRLLQHQTTAPFVRWEPLRSPVSTHWLGSPSVTEMTSSRCNTMKTREKLSASSRTAKSARAPVEGEGFLTHFTAPNSVKSWVQPRSHNLAPPERRWIRLPMLGWPVPPTATSPRNNPKTCTNGVSILMAKPSLAPSPTTPMEKRPPIVKDTELWDSNAPRTDSTHTLEIAHDTSHAQEQKLTSANVPAVRLGTTSLKFVIGRIKFLAAVPMWLLTMANKSVTKMTQSLLVYFLINNWSRAFGTGFKWIVTLKKIHFADFQLLRDGRTDERTDGQTRLQRQEHASGKKETFGNLAHHTSWVYNFCSCCLSFVNISFIGND